MSGHEHERLSAYLDDALAPGERAAGRGAPRRLRGVRGAARRARGRGRSRGRRTVRGAARLLRVVPLPRAGAARAPDGHAAPAGLDLGGGGCVAAGGRHPAHDLATRQTRPRGRVPGDPLVGAGAGVRQPRGKGKPAGERAAEPSQRESARGEQPSRPPRPSRRSARPGSRRRRPRRTRGGSSARRASRAGRRGAVGFDPRGDGRGGFVGRGARRGCGPCWPQPGAGGRRAQGRRERPRVAPSARTMPGLRAGRLPRAGRGSHGRAEAREGRFRMAAARRLTTCARRPSGAGCARNGDASWRATRPARRRTKRGCG